MDDFQPRAETRTIELLCQTTVANNGRPLCQLAGMSMVYLSGQIWQGRQPHVLSQACWFFLLLTDLVSYRLTTEGTCDQCWLTTLVSLNDSGRVKFSYFYTHQTNSSYFYLSAVLPKCGRCMSEWQVLMPWSVLSCVRVRLCVCFLFLFVF